MQYSSDSSIFSRADWLEGVNEFDASSFKLENNIFVERSSTEFTTYTTDFASGEVTNVLVGRNTYKLPSGMVSPKTIIGRYCSISHFVNIGANNHNYNNLSTSFGDDGGINDCYTIIGCDVWMGVNSNAIGGAHIGHGAVIGAGAVVKKEVPPYAIVVGNKAEVIKMRFSDEIISDLLELKWWTLPQEVIMKLPYKDIKECVKKLKEIRKYPGDVMDICKI